MKKKSKNNNELISNNIDGPIRKMAVAGSFYPSDEVELGLMIDGFLNKVELPQLEPNIRAIIVPHAGYVYSGQVAAYAYKALIGKDVSRVIIIGNSHQEFFDGASIYPKGYFETPLGKVEIDNDFAQKLMEADKKIYFKESAHLEEHSLEVQLPFLQKVLPVSGWKIVPIILGNQEDSVDILIDVLKNLIDDNTLIVVSSDLSHYPKYEDANYSDGKVIDAILSGKGDNLKKTISELEKEGISNLQTCACASNSIEVVMGLMGDKNSKLLKYANSGDVSGDKSRVVGYASIVFMDSNLSTGSGLFLSKQQQKRLLEIAKDSVETYIKDGKILEIKENDPELGKPLGAFVTLKEEGELRGCIGVFTGDVDEPLYKIVSEMAISAAVNDPRFNPITKNELDKLDYEISVLNPLKKVSSWKDIEIGKHGVRIIRGSRAGVFLPQVALENNWDLDTFMNVLCTQKAGLPADCWKDKDTEIYVFTAQVFED
ncbi:MAG: AmmeMemoRadiSam system protein B [Candidatus Omnitrophota bacterium]|nr:AmmeMemoRadiSam system protein B [Candidatus Omnitrophota bacterium]